MGYDAFVFLLTFFVVAAVVGIIWTFYAAKKRREALAALAAGMGLEFSPGDPFGICRRYSIFDWIAQGHSQKAYNVIYGRIGNYEVRAFDFTYRTTEGSGKDRREVTHFFSAVIFDTPGAFYPLLIRPEGFLDRIAGAFGFDDIDFESDEFSRRFYVKCADKRFAYDVIHPRMMEFLLARRCPSLQLSGVSVMLYTGATFKPEEFRYYISFVKEFLDLFPEYLWQKMRGAEGVK